VKRAFRDREEKSVSWKRLEKSRAESIRAELGKEIGQEGRIESKEKKFMQSRAGESKGKRAQHS
jgi:hypothetical protein